MSSLILDRLSVGYTEPVVEDAHLCITCGSLVALIGRNGSGKSTLLRSIAGLLSPLSGDISFDKKSLKSLTPRERAKIMSFVSTQKMRLHGFTTYEMVAMGRTPYTDWADRLREEDHRATRAAMQATGTTYLEKKQMSELSDGECQRVMIARALAQDTPLILLDEPTAFLDLPNRYDLALLLQQLAHEEQKAVLFSTHDLDIALQLCDQILLIDQKQLITQTREESITSEYICRLFSNDAVHFDPKTGQITLLSKQ